MGHIIDRALNKALNYPGTEPYVGAFKDAMDTDKQFESIIREAYSTRGKAAILDTVKWLGKEAGAFLTDAEADNVAEAIIAQVLGRSTNVGSAYGTWHPSGVKVDDEIAESRQPHGGSENFVNVAQPGMGPAKRTATPGESGSSTGRAGTGKETYPTEQYPPQSQDTRGRQWDPQSSEGLPAYGINAVPGQSAHGPVGQAGDVSHIPSNQFTRPGDVHPTYKGGLPILGYVVPSPNSIYEGSDPNWNNISGPKDKSKGPFRKIAAALLLKHFPSNANHEEAFSARPSSAQGYTEEEELARFRDEDEDEAEEFEAQARRYDDEAAKSQHLSEREYLRNKARYFRTQAMLTRKSLPRIEVRKAK